MNNNPYYDKLMSCYESLRQKTNFTPKVALVLGSGLGSFADEIQVEATVDYKEIAGFPVSTVVGHKGRFVFGYVETVPVVIMQGRVHYYEGYSMEEVVLPIRLMKLMGAEKLVLTNAAGGIHYQFKPGTLMIITDQIASFVPSPLIGPNIEQLGTRFPDMSQIYSENLRKILEESGRRLNIPLKEGVYIQFSGPAYETPTEVRMARILGADACGMSTACEAVAGKHMGMEICGISCISNMASGIEGKPLSHSEVQETANLVAQDFKNLLWDAVSKME